MGSMDANAVTRCWYHPAPAWLVWGAVAATGVLFACDCIPWWWLFFIEMKGWPVLLAVAVVGAVLILLPVWMLAALVFRRRVQFGLRTVIVFVILCVVVSSWLAVRIAQARRQAEVVARINKIDGVIVSYDFREDRQNHPHRPSPAPEPLIRLLGVDFFADVVDLFGRDDFKSHYPQFPNDPYYPQHRDAALADVAALKQLEFLFIGGDEVTDAGLSQLETLANLRCIYISHTKVTKKGLAKFHHALPDCGISAYPTRMYIDSSCGGVFDDDRSASPRLLASLCSTRRRQR